MSVTHVAHHFLAPFHKWLAHEGVTEFVINKPGECHIETREGWEHHDDPMLTFERIDGIARSIANATNQQFGRQNPILSATLTTGERVQFVSEPIVRPGCISVTVRKPGAAVMALEDYKEQGAFDIYRIKRGRKTVGAVATAAEKERIEELEKELDSTALELINLLEKGDLVSFLRLAVKSRKNIVVCGAVNSGKTTLMKSLISEVDAEERLLSIENVDELGLDRMFKNCVPMFYSAGGQGEAPIDQQTLVQSSLRMRPERIILAELITGDEAFAFIDAINRGHPGSITSFHSESVNHAWSTLALMVKQSGVGRGLDYEVIRNLLGQTIQIVIHVKSIEKDRKVTEVFYDPVATALALES
jgi:type IV secretion system protein VirB11